MPKTMHDNQGRLTLPQFLLVWLLAMLFFGGIWYVGELRTWVSETPELQPAPGPAPILTPRDRSTARPHRLLPNPEHRERVFFPRS